MRDKRKYEELFPEEFMEIMGKTPICYWACGPMEYHGLQNTLGIDPAKAYEICLRAATISGGIVFPLVPFAPSGAAPSLKRVELRKAMKKHPQSLMTCVDTCERLYTELFESLADMGFKACVAFGGHGPAGALLKKIETAFGGKMDAMLFATCTSTTFIRDIVRKSEVKKFGHGGMWETSMNMAVNPEFADLARTRGPADGKWPAFSGFEKYPDELLDGIMKSNPAFGNKLIDVSARNVAEIAMALLHEKRLIHPGYVIECRVSPVLTCQKPLASLPCPTATESSKFATRVFQNTLCAIPEFSQLYRENPLFVYYAFDLDCSESMRLDLGLGYDGPVKVWLDQQVCFLDEQGKPPSSARDGGPKTEIPLTLKQGRHEVLIALVSQKGFPAGVRARLTRMDDKGNALPFNP